MSHNQSRADTRESSQYRRTGRSGSFNQDCGGRGSGGGGATPPVSSTSNPSLSSNRSFNKMYNSAQGGQQRVSGASADSDSHQNGAQQQQPLRGASDVSVANANAPLPNSTVKPTDALTHKVTRAVPRAPKKIEEVHPAQDRYAQTTWFARTPSLGGSTRRGQPMDFAPRGSMLSSPGSQMGGFRPMSPQVRGFGMQDIREDERHSFEKLFRQIKELNIDNVVTFCGVVSWIFDKALMEPAFCEMYANVCLHLEAELPYLSVDNEKITFKRLLLNKCQEEFERGEREEQESNATNEEGEVKLSAEEREEKRVEARRRKLGNIRLIGELYKKRMLTERIMHECIKKLLGDHQNPDESNVEALCELMSTIGDVIDHAKAKEHIDAYFDRMEKLTNNMELSSRVRFMLKDSIDLRKNKWQQRRKVEGPKKIEEVHRDAAQEKHAQATRLARTPSLGGSTSRGQPMDFASRGSMLSSPGSQVGGFRPMSPQVRGFGMQDLRVDERHSFENRTLSLPLTQRPLGDDPITLGPQGGLTKGMSSRGQPTGPSIPFTDNMPSYGDSRRMAHAQNGYGSLRERAPYGSREELTSKYMPDRLSSQHDQASAPERNMAYGSRDRGFNTSRPASPLVRSGGPTSTQNVAFDKIWPEERLRDMSMAAIKEFYSATDEKEVALCVKDLNSPSFYPSMISLWVTDSFERKDMERDLLAKLIICLTKSGDVVISQDQLVKGFESVLAGLEDAVNDAPRAAEFLGRIFAKVILEKVIPFNEIGRLIYEGGEEEGRLVETGLAAEVLGSTLEMIKLEKGDSVVSEFCRSSNMRLENFRPQGSNKQWKLDKFI